MASCQGALIGSVTYLFVKGEFALSQRPGQIGLLLQHCLLYLMMKYLVTIVVKYTFKGFRHLLEFIYNDMVKFKYLSIMNAL